MGYQESFIGAVDREGNPTKPINFTAINVVWQCISERLWNFLVGRYGGCLEERYNEAYDDRANHAKALDAPAKYALMAVKLIGQVGSPRPLTAPINDS